jgi:hypothetical protein
MAFITHCWKNARLDLIGLLTCVSLALGMPGSAWADVPTAEITLLKLEQANDSVLLTATIKFELPSVVEDALQKGVPLFFVAEADILRERWYWSHKKVLSVERHMRLAYQPLTRRWRLNVASGLITNAGLGMALNQNFDTLHDALAAVQRLSRWNIAEVADINLDQRHFVDFRFRLDVSQLPRPLLIGTMGQSDWDISASIRRPLVLESIK